MLKNRRAQSNDIPQLRQLEQLVIEAERPYNSAIKSEKVVYYDLQRLISSDAACVLLAEKANAIVATGYLEIRSSKASLNHEQHGYLGFMFVAPGYRRQGINQAILEKLISWGKELGVADFYLDVYAQNQAAIGAYAKLGFEPCLIEMKLSQ